MTPARSKWTRQAFFLSRIAYRRVAAHGIVLDRLRAGEGVRLLWYVGVGASIGGMSRFVLGSYIQQRAGGDFPTGTLVINVTGSFVLGIIMRYAFQTDAVSPEMRALLASGFCGGYTTFSTFSYETAILVEDGEYGRAALYVGSSVAVALLFMFLGFATAQRLLPGPTPG